MQLRYTADGVTYMYALKGPTALMSLIVAAAFTELERPPAGMVNQCLNVTRSHDYCCEIGGDFYCTPTNKVSNGSRSYTKRCMQQHSTSLLVFITFQPQIQRAAHTLSLALCCVPC